MENNTFVKTKNESAILLILEGLKQFMELFSGPFLITYFIELSADSAVIISFYQICSSVAIAIMSYFVGRIVRNRFKLGMFRLSILMNLIYIVFFIVFSDRVIEFIPIVAAMYGVSAACYWYPTNILNSLKISDEDRPSFFAKERVIVTLVSVISPILLGTLITELSYTQTAFAIAGISFLQLVISFLLKPLPVTNKPPFKVKEAWKYFINDEKFRLMMYSHFCMGQNINGGALTSIALIGLLNAVKTDQKVGAATSVANILVILGIAFFRKMYKDKNPRYFIYLNGAVPAVIFLVSRVSDSEIFPVLFFVAYNACMNIIMPTHSVCLYSVLARGSIGTEYREEYFSVTELVLGLGRVTSYLLLLFAGLTGSDTVMAVISWILVLLVFINSCLINRFLN